MNLSHYMAGQSTIASVSVQRNTSLNSCAETQMDSESGIASTVPNVKNRNRLFEVVVSIGTRRYRRTSGCNDMFVATVVAKYVARLSRCSEMSGATGHGHQYMYGLNFLQHAAAS